MKKLILAGIAVAALTSGAQAADLGMPRGPVDAVVAVPAFSWTGFYLGAHIGYGWGRAAGPFYFPGGLFVSSEPLSPSGVFGGAQIGYNWQVNSFVLGLETDISASGFTQSALYNVSPSYTKHARINWLGSARVRAGFAVDRALLYVTGGLGYGGIRQFTTGGLADASSSRTRVGYTVGAGIEYAFASNWTAKLEYLYYNFGTSNYVVSVGGEYFRSTPQVHTVKLGVNYLFSTGPGAVVARY